VGKVQESFDSGRNAKTKGTDVAYGRFVSMIATSTLIMFGAMYLNSYEASHVWFSETRAYMALLMGSIMALVMLLFMQDMYKNRMINGVIIASSLAIFAGSLWLVRSQETVEDISYMKAMIPHHSIAILTSKRAHIRDPRVRELADGIIKAQVKEISQMEELIRDLSLNPLPADAPDLFSQKQNGERESTAFQ
jgi:hypothetical protein